MGAAAGAELGVAGLAAGPGIARAAYSGVDERVLEVLGLLTSRLEKIEAAIKFQKTGSAAARPRNRRGKGLDGFRAGSSLAPPIGFDRENRRALPLCHRRGREGEGKKCHGYRECPYGGKNAAGTAAYCMAADGEGADEAMRTLALCQIFQVAADDGSDAFAAAVLAEYGAPAVLAGGESNDIDVSAYDFTVSLVENEDVIEHRAPADAVTRPPPMPWQVVCLSRWCTCCGASVGGAFAAGGYMTHAHPATEEFPGGVETIPVRHYAPAITLGPVISAVTCSFQPAGDSFVEQPEAIGGGTLPRAIGAPSSVGPDWDGAPPSPPCSPPPSDHKPEEVVEPALNGNQQSALAGLHGGGGSGIDLAVPPHRA
ncbi:hypothetical protein CYMTET_16680, partial [Cymbomonas tetramitiformis]